MYIFETRTNSEFSRGIVTSLVTGVIMQTLTYVFMTNNSNKEIVLYILIIIGNLLSYSMDILFAKDKLNGVSISYYDLNTRLRYLLEKMVSYQIVKFFILVCIDLITISWIYKKASEFLDRKKVQFKHRDQILLFCITALLFLLYGNILRFKWVYAEKTNQSLDAIIIAIFSILILFRLS